MSQYAIPGPILLPPEPGPNTAIIKHSTASECCLIISGEHKGRAFSLCGEPCHITVTVGTENGQIAEGLLQLLVSSLSRYQGY